MINIAITNNDLDNLTTFPDICTLTVKLSVQFPVNILTSL